MKLSEKIRQELLQIAMEAAEAAGKMIRQLSKGSFQVFQKEGTSITSQVVTEVDFKSEELILQHFNPTIEKYRLGLLTEETTDDQTRLTKDYFWCIDPLDGTLPFAENQKGYAVSIALVSQSGESEISVVFDPVHEIIYAGLKGKGLSKNKVNWVETTYESENEDTLVLFMDRSFRTDPLYADQTLLNQMAEKAGYKELEIIMDHGGVMNAVSVLEHPNAAYFKFPKVEKGGGSIWDYAATAGLFREAKKPVTDFWEQPLNLNNPETTYMHQKGILYASNDIIAQAVRSCYYLRSESTK